MSAAKDERQSTETLSFRCWREWCRLTRGAVVKQRRNEFANKRRSAFTLAEVLITLGIIGVVAALTLPTLIQNYQKKLVATRLAHFSSVMQQGDKMRTAQSIEGTFEGMDTSEVRAYNPDDMLNFVERYWKPFVKLGKIEKLQKGVVAAFPNGSGAYFVRTSNVQTWVTSASYILFCPEYKDCKNIDENKNVTALATRRTIFVFWNDARPERLFGATDGKSLSREFVLNQCKSMPYFCAYLLERDGWEIRDDYPW